MPCGSEIQVRVAAVGDSADIVAFNRAMAMETEGKELPPVVVEAGVRAALSDNGRARYYVADVDGQLVGQTMVTSEWSDWRNGLFWWIQSVYVSPAFRQRGVFRTIHRFIRDEAKKRPDVCGLRLYAHHTNNSAIETYRRLGMKQTEYILLEEDWADEARVNATGTGAYAADGLGPAVR